MPLNDENLQFSHLSQKIKKKKIIHHTILLSPLNGSVDSLFNITIALKNIQHIKLIKTETQIYWMLLVQGDLNLEILILL